MKTTISRRRGTIISAAALALTTGIVLGVFLREGRVGVADKTLWDWLDLLIVPAVLFFGGVLFARADARSEQESSTEITRANALQTYLDRMSDLILSHDLRGSEGDSDLRIIARARTLTIVSELDGDAVRKGAVIRFLYEADLIGAPRTDPVIEMRGASLEGTRLDGLFLNAINLSRADLSYTSMRGVLLSNSVFIGSVLTGADMRGGRFARCAFGYAVLRNVDLRDANLRGADFRAADLRGALLDGADREGANFEGAKFDDAREGTGRSRGISGPTKS